MSYDLNMVHWLVNTLWTINYTMDPVSTWTTYCQHCNM